MVKIDSNACTGCSVCLDVCPVNAIKIEKKKAVVNDNCIECGVCIRQCPNDAIKF